ncbi:MAG: KamA family radical SAM protein [Planctomycetes bacterium]|nr:KamA family radical SAM protein [Planctomycetota bacterium]
MERTLAPVQATAPVAPRTGRAHFYPDVADAQWNDWKWQFRHRITKLEELEKFLPIPAGERALRADVLRDFRMGITPYYLSLVDADDPADPILRQVAPIAEEYLFRDVGEEDPLGEERYSPVPGITHRYPDRVLMVISNSCAIYCRYCTRKRIMYEDAVPDVEIDRMVDYIAKTPRVRDVIVSGGDPLTYGTKKLESILSKLRAIPHLEIIRIGSRVPVSLPQRIDDELCAMLAQYHPLWINVHFNHPRELTPDAAAACDKLSRAGIPLNNQSVLLKGVNDDVPTMRALCTGLMKMRVRPYYLYQCDQIRGAEHFRTPVAKGIEVIEGLRGHISGLAVPTFVIDAPGGGGKVPVMPQYLLQHDTKNQRVVLRNFQDRLFVYHEPTGRARSVGERSGELDVDATPPITAETTATNGNGASKAASHAGAPAKNGNGKSASTRSNGSAAARVGADGKPVVGKSRWVHRGHSREERVRKANET